MGQNSCPAPSNRRHPTVATNGIETYYQVAGDDPPVVLLHGARMDGRLWAETTRPLAATRLIIPDLRGHGRAGGSARTEYSVELFAADVQALVDALDPGQPVVVGHWLGGFVALVYAARHTAACAGLVTLGGEVAEPLSLGGRLERYRPALVNAVAPVLGCERVKELLRRVDEWRYDKRGKGDPEAIERIHQRYGDDVPLMTGPERRKLDDTVAAYHAVAFDHSAIAVSSLHLYGEDKIP